MTFQVYKQPDDGAVDIDGASMERGWYWVKMRSTEANAGEFQPFGKSTGPFKTKREAERDAKQKEKA